MANFYLFTYLLTYPPLLSMALFSFAMSSIISYNGLFIILCDVTFELRSFTLISCEFQLKNSSMSFSFDSRIPSESEGFLKDVKKLKNF